jgi:hypothetical protein
MGNASLSWYLSWSRESGQLCLDTQLDHMVVDDTPAMLSAMHQAMHFAHCS